MKEDFNPPQKTKKRRPGQPRVYNRMGENNDHVLFIRVSEDVHKVVRQIARVHSVSISGLVAKFLEAAIASGRLK